MLLPLSPCRSIVERCAQAASGRIQKFVVTLQEGLSAESLLGFLEEHMPVKFLMDVEDSPGEVTIYAPASSRHALETLLANYWKMQAPSGDPTFENRKNASATTLNPV
jgi:hypothetical protein